jgi:hypothetical protein
VLIFRLLFLASAAAIAVCAAGYLLSGDRRYLRWALTVVKLAGAAGLVFFSVLLLERIV